MIKTTEAQECYTLARLTLKERRFVEAYVGEAAGNARKAAILAGYAGKLNTVSQTALETLRRPHVREAIAALIELDPLVPSRVERLRLIGAHARGETTYDRLTAEGTVEKLQVMPKDQLTALRMLGELCGEYQRPDDKERDILPDNLTPEELFALAGVPRPGSYEP